MARRRVLAPAMAALLLVAAWPGRARADPPQEPLPWQRGWFMPGFGIGVSPGQDVTSLQFGLSAEYFVANGVSLGLSLTDEVVIYSPSVRGRLPTIEVQLPTNIFYMVPTLRWVFFRRYRFSPYVMAGVGPAFFNNDGGTLGYWEAGPGAFIGLVGGLFLELGVEFSSAFPGSKCDSAFVYEPTDGGDPVQLARCGFAWAPKIGLAYAIGFGKARKRAKEREQREKRRRERSPAENPMPQFKAPPPPPTDAPAEREPVPEGPVEAPRDAAASEDAAAGSPETPATPEDASESASPESPSESGPAADGPGPEDDGPGPEGAPPSDTSPPAEAAPPSVESPTPDEPTVSVRAPQGQRKLPRTAKISDRHRKDHM